MTKKMQKKNLKRQNVFALTKDNELSEGDELFRLIGSTGLGTLNRSAFLLRRRRMSFKLERSHNTHP